MAVGVLDTSVDVLVNPSSHLIVVGGVSDEIGCLRMILDCRSFVLDFVSNLSVELFHGRVHSNTAVFGDTEIDRGGLDSF